MSAPLTVAERFRRFLLYWYCRVERTGSFRRNFAKEYPESARGQLAEDLRMV